MSRKQTQRESRRKFLEQLGVSLAYLALATGKSRQARAAQDGLLQRRHLITIQGGGACGYDSYSFHSSPNPEFMKNVTIHMPKDHVPYYTGLSNVAPVMPEGGAAGGWTPRRAILGSQLLADGFVHPNYLSDPYVYLGPGMSIFQGSGLLESDIAICAGMGWRDGGHHTGAYVLNSGMRSRYAACFSSHVSAALAKLGPKPLHYAHISGTPLEAHTGLIGGFGEPVAISDSSSWTAMTTPNADDVPLSRRSALNATINELVKTACTSRFALKESKTLFEAFLGAYNGAASIAGSNYATGTALPLATPQFPALWSAYTTEVTATIKAHPFWQIYTTHQTTPPANPDVTKLTFRFALADFLVRNNLSAVVDLQGAFADGHDTNDAECISVLATFACLKRLLLNLKGSPLPGSSGKSLLDATTVAMYTEWDRYPRMSFTQLSLAGRPGTGHGVSASVILAGAGVNGGKVVGGVKTGPGEGPFAGFSAEGVELSPGNILPIDLATGRPSRNGQNIYIESFFPTMMSLFGVSVPPQQQTQDGTLPILLKS